MTYPQHTWVTGEVITKEKLNNIEGGVAANDTAIAEANTAIATKASTADMTAALATKANTSDMTTALAAKADTTAVEAALATKAEIDGSYEGMTVGNAEQLVATVGVEDKVPYQFRTSGGSADIGDREVDKLVGGTVAWNQLVQNGNFASWSGWSGRQSTLSVSNGIATITPSSDGYERGLIGDAHGLTADPSHRYLFSVDVFCPIASQIRLSFSGTGNAPSLKSSVANVWTHIDQLWKSASTPSNGQPYALVQSSLTTSQSVQYKNFNVFDLTQMFGSTIADYIYSLEQSTAGAGVTWFRKLFPKPYYAYNAGELMSVSGVASHDMTGFNQWDEDWELGSIDATTGTNTTSNSAIRPKNYIPVIANTAYFFNIGGLGDSWFRVAWYDANKNFISGASPYASGRVQTSPSNASFMRFATNGLYGNTYKNDICINLAWDNSRNGEYEPYVKRSYPLDSTLTLRGIPKLDANNELYYDGDTYESDGTVTRRYGIVDLGTLNWGYANSIFRVEFPQMKRPCDLMCTKYPQSYETHIENIADKTIWNKNYAFTPNNICIKDSAYTDSASFKTAMSGVYLVYELAEPTTEEADPYQNPQVVDDFGTEEYVTDSIVPVGHETQYQANLRAKLEMAPNSPEGNGDYIVRQSNGVNTYVPITFPADELPAAPTTNGNYVLKCTVTDGVATFTWASA